MYTNAHAHVDTTDNGRLFHYDRDFGEFPSLNLEAYPNRYADSSLNPTL